MPLGLAYLSSSLSSSPCTVMLQPALELRTSYSMDAAVRLANAKLGRSSQTPPRSNRKAMVEKSVNRVEASQAMMGVGMAASVVVARVSLGDADTASRGERVNHPETHIMPPRWYRHQRQQRFISVVMFI